MTARRKAKPVWTPEKERVVKVAIAAALAAIISAAPQQPDPMSIEGMIASERKRQQPNADGQASPSVASADSPKGAAEPAPSAPITAPQDGLLCSGDSGLTGARSAGAVTLSDAEIDVMACYLLNQHELFPLTPTRIRQLCAQAKLAARLAQGPSEEELTAIENLSYRYEDSSAVGILVRAVLRWHEQTKEG